MEEVVGRRYRRLAEEEKPFPDLVVIDGGRGQVGSALKAFLVQDLEPPEIIGLAKRHETIIFADERPPMRLPLSHGGLQLLQRLRDEAHRFANTYNADLRSKKVKESILDDFPGLGLKKRALLMKRFGTIENLRKAPLDDLKAVEGIGPVIAKRLSAFLQTNQK
jgi:excinuclease ABC subunit C